DGSFCQNLCGLLEGGRRQERVGGKRSFGNTQHYMFSFCRFFSFCDQLLIFLFKIQNIYQCSWQEVCISIVLHTDLLQHLTYDNLDVLIVDLNTLETVNSLYLAEHVVLYGANAFDTKD